jgi:hypothetical protein
VKIRSEKEQNIAQEPAATATLRSQPDESSLAVRAISLETSEGPAMLDGLSKPTADDGSTQVSSSDGSQKQPAFDSKSLASVNTFAMDEKDSVRPDDSASIRAVEEEDTFSAPGTGPTGSRVGSDSGARAFRDQLHQITVMGAMSRGGPPPTFQPAAILKPGLPFDESAVAQPAPPQGLTIIGMQVPMPAGNGPFPDEKLLEALASHKDRVFVLKLEQDVIDFVQNTKYVSAPEQGVSLTNLKLGKCNSIYRKRTPSTECWRTSLRITSCWTIVWNIMKTAFLS